MSFQFLKLDQKLVNIGITMSQHVREQQTFTQRQGKPTNNRRQQFFQHKQKFETRDAHEYPNKSCVFCDDKT